MYVLIHSDEAKYALSNLWRDEKAEVHVITAVLINPVESMGRSAVKASERNFVSSKLSDTYLILSILGVTEIWHRQDQVEAQRVSYFGRSGESGDRDVIRHRLNAKRMGRYFNF